MKKLTKLNEAISDFNWAARVLQEDYGMGPEYGHEEMMAQGEMPQDISHYRGNEGQDAQSQEEQKTDMNLSKSDKRIAQIREIALDGLQDYAQDVDCEAYQFYKKIWLMCDKAVSEKESASNGGSAV